ncbi:NFX1-type zinc finger-containing protein 1 [Neofusicoccum parvum]|uniref:NFX1-type zinc finger-containing protein 1 n=1 Tax=Neofusicoccum parvum TaxID=310453 RepID=A0ACB5SC42_9PEZI|nr:NFX1-type zinc finger-containing protein 1 [Neofusicoccum parvum]
MAVPSAPDEARSARLAGLFTSVIKGKRAVATLRDAKLFFEAICDQNDATACVERLVASDSASDALRASLRFDVSNVFINDHLECFLRYLRDPVLKQVCNGEFLRRLLIPVVDPPSLWDSVVKAHSQNQLSLASQHAYAWLLLELLTWTSHTPSNLQSVAQDIVDTEAFVNSDDHDVRTLGHRIMHVLHAKSVSIAAPVSGPGGRHDNDRIDFREISIYPTEDEVISKEKPFYRRADTVGQTPSDQRVAVHLDNQFRLLREDMLAELRDDLKISQSNKGRRTNTRLRGLSLAGFYCGTERRRSAFSTTVTCKSGLERLSKRTPEQRKALLKDDRKFLKHQSFGCLMEDGKVIAFATLDRVEDLLAQEPPVVTLRISETKSLERVLLALKLSKDVDFLLVDTAMFAYEPILDCLQRKLELPLSDELLALEESEDRIQPSSICPEDIVQKIEGMEGKNLDSTLNLPKQVDLDPSQTESLLAGLAQTVSLIQGPPG